jgi:transcriptional regulator with XRE-family HTH domain
MTDLSGPTARQRRLAAELRGLRENAGLTPEEAAGALGWSRPKLVKIETARRIPSVGDVGHILDAYGGTDQAIRLALMKLAGDVRQRGWWAAYGDVLAGSYAELEDAADTIRSWQVQLVPGLLQTVDYARELIHGGLPDDPTEADRRIQARITRRALLARQNPPRLEIVLAEEVLRRPIGGWGVMRGQLMALQDAAKLPNVSLRVVPISSGRHPMIGQGSMVIFEFPSPVDLSVAYLETVAGGVYVEDVAQVKRCSVKFDRISGAALTEDDSADLIAAIIEE